MEPDTYLFSEDVGHDTQHMSDSMYLVESGRIEIVAGGVVMEVRVCVCACVSHV